MIRHYLTFAHEAVLLDRLISGCRFLACHALDRDRFGIVVDGIAERDTEADYAGVEISVARSLGYALPSRSVRPPKRNRRDLFESLRGRTFSSVRIDDSERAIRFSIDENTELVVPFYGPGRGNLLLVRDGSIIESARGVGQEYDSLIDRADEEDPVGSEIVDELTESDLPVGKALVKIIRGVGPTIAIEALDRLGIDRSIRFADVDGARQEAVLQSIDRLYDEAAGASIYRLYTGDGVGKGDLFFSLIEIERYEHDPAIAVEPFDDIARAVARYRSLFYRTNRFDDLHRRLLRELDRRIGRLEKSLRQGLDPEEFRRRSEEMTETGNLILANAHAIEKGSEEARLIDFSGASITIRLDPRKSAVENAEHFFRKGKGARRQIEESRTRSEKTERNLDRLVRVRKKVESVDRPDGYDELRGLAEGIVPIDPDQASQQSREPKERFRRFEIAGQLEVFVGKNAKNNDELTMKFARPHDIWMHARGLPGSHLLLRWNERDRAPAPAQLEEAASIAAWYSGGRGSGLVPVIWTRRKYLRKPKGSAPGAVLVDREEVLLVEPKLPASDKEGRSSDGS